MDFKQILSTTTDYNFHSHTEFCDGHAPMETMARAAVSAGMRHYGFSPHSPIPIPSPCNMPEESVEAFMNEYRRISALPELAACRFYLSMEIDYLSPEWSPANEYFRQLPLDYRIGSVHFIPCQDGTHVDIDGKFEAFKRRMAGHFHNDIEYVVDTFYRQTAAMIEAGGFDIIGHFDKVAQNASLYAPDIEDSSFYRSKVLDTIELLGKHNYLIELNTKARTEHRRFFPDTRYWGDIADCGLTFVVNSDAHHPDRITASRDEAFELLKRFPRHCYACQES